VLREMDALVAGNWLSLVWAIAIIGAIPPQRRCSNSTANGNVDVCHGPGWAGNFVVTNIVGAATAGGWNRAQNRVIAIPSAPPPSTSMATSSRKDVPITSNSEGVGLDSDNGNNTYFTNLLVTFGNENVSAASISSQPQAETVFVGDAARLTVGTGGTLATPLYLAQKRSGYSRAERQHIHHPGRCGQR